MKIKCCLFFLMWASVIFADPALSVHVEDSVRKIKLSELKDKLKSEEISLYNPYYKKQKRYNAIPLHAVFDHVFGDLWKGKSYTEMAFIALDGYKAIGSLTSLKQLGGYLAFEDLDVPDWEPIGRKKSNPGPFYIVWQGREQTINNGYPWPYQLSELKLMTFKQSYPKVYPASVNKNSEIYKGFILFKTRCFACHSISKEGGKIGPDLNSPRNITTYRSEKILKEFIKKPSSFRYGKMPDNPDLSTEELNALYQYLVYIGKKK